MDVKQSLLQWLTHYIPNPQLLEDTFQAYFTDLPYYVDASWRMDGILDMLYYVPDYDHSIIP